jgi:hypothetical protein
LNEKRNTGFWILISIGVLLTILLLAGQTFSLINYDLTVSLGLQESVEEISEVGVAWNEGFAFGDTVIYLPLLLIGIIGLLKRKSWGIYSMFGALAITVYWPVVILFTIFTGRTALNLDPDKYVSYSIILPLIAIYGLWGMWYLYKNRDIFMN